MALRLGRLRSMSPSLLRAIEVTPAVAVTVDREEDLRLELAEAVDNGARAKVGRAARPDRAEAGRREERNDRFGDVRHVGDDAVAACRRQARTSPARTAATCFASSAYVTVVVVLEPACLGACDERGMIVAPGERVLRVIQLGAREPRRTGHRVAREDALVASARSDLEEVPDRGPEGVEVGHRPAPEVLIGAEAQTALACEPLHVARDVRARDRLVARTPDRLDRTILDAG